MTAASRPAPRLDERAIGPDTTIRFALLVVLLLVATGAMTYGSTLTVTDALGLDLCALNARDPRPLDPYDDNISDTIMIDVARACLSPPWWAVPAWTLLLLAGSCALFWIMPRWRARPTRLVPLAAVDQDGEITRMVEESAATAGLAKVPRIVVDPAAASGGAVVFGSTGRPTVCLHGGLLARRFRDPEGVRAVLLHEFAHIRNGDVTLTYATVAMWRVFLALVLVPYATWAVVEPDDAQFVTGSLLLTAVMLALVYLARSDVLRSRELYADLAAVRWGADPRGWGGEGPRSGGGGSRRLRAFAELWRTHPRWDLRRTTMVDPAVLFLARTLPMLLTGVAGALIYSELPGVLIDFSVPSSFIGEAGALAAAALVTAVVGISLWRAVAHALATGLPVPSGLRSGVWLGVGMVAAELAKAPTGTQWLPSHPENLPLIVLVMAVFGWWVAGCAHLCLTVWPGRTVRAAMLVGLASAGLVLAAWFEWWQGWGSSGLWTAHPPWADFPGDAARHPADAVVMAVTRPIPAGLLGSALALPAVALLWVTPLLAWLIPPRRGQLPSLRSVLRFAALGAAGCWLAIAATMAYLHTWPSQGARGFYVWAFQAWLLVAMGAAITLATAAACIAVPCHRLPRALIIAGIAAVAGLAGMFVLASFDGCVEPLNTLASSCRWRPASGWMLVRLQIGPVLVVAAIAAAAAAAIGAAVGRVRTPVAEPAPATGGLAVRRVGVVVLCVAAVAIAFAGVTPHPPASSDGFSFLLHRMAFPDQAAAPPQTRAMEVVAWVDGGGLELRLRYIEELDRFGTALHAAAGKPAFEESVFGPICVRLSRLARHAERHPPVPDPEAQTRWQAFIGKVHRAGRDCERAFALKDMDLFRAATAQLLDAGKADELAWRRIQTVIREGYATL